MPIGLCEEVKWYFLVKSEELLFTSEEVVRHLNTSKFELPSEQLAKRVVKFESKVKSVTV